MAAGLAATAALVALLHLAAGQPLAVSLLEAVVAVVVVRGVLVAWTGWSLGGWVTGVRLVDARTLEPSPLGVFLYTDLTVVIVVTTCGLGMFLLMRSVRDDPQLRGWHDRVSGLVALHLPRRREAPGSHRPPSVPATAASLPQGQAGPRAGAQAQHRPQPPAPSPAPVPASGTAPQTRPTPAITRRGLRRLPASGTAPADRPRNMPGFTNESATKVVPSQPMDAQPPREQSRLSQQPPTTAPSPQPAGPRPHAAQDNGTGRPSRRGAQEEGVFAAERYSFSSRRSHGADVAHTFDTTSVASADDRSAQALIDSVPWSAVPTQLDPTTVDSLPDKIRTVIEDEHLMPSPGSSGSPDSLTPASATPDTPASPSPRGPVDLLDPAGVPAPASAASTGSAPSEPSPVPPVPPSSADSVAPAAQTAGRSVPPTIEVPALRPPRPAQPSPGTRAQAGSSAPHQDVAAPSQQPATDRDRRTRAPSAPPLSVRLVPLLGGEPVVIHEPTVIGRDPDNISSYPGAERVSITDPTRSVSKTHAAIFPLLDGVWVTDLHSTNGSRVEHKDGSSVQAVPDVALAALEGTTVFFGRIGFRIEVVS